jgi:hypothetical protein
MIIVCLIKSKFIRLYPTSRQSNRRLQRVVAFRILKLASAARSSACEAINAGCELSVPALIANSRVKGTGNGTSPCPAADFAANAHVAANSQISRGIGCNLSSNNPGFFIFAVLVYND